MNLHKVIIEITHVPRNLHRLNSVSIYTLLKESGYFETHSLVSIGDIRAALELEPRCVEEWLVYSEDKRCDSGWYFMQTEKNKYVVDYYPPGDKAYITYDDPLDACAAFIMKEIEDIKQCG